MISKSALTGLWLLAILITVAALLATGSALLTTPSADPALNLQSQPADTSGLKAIADDIRPVIAILERYRTEHGRLPLTSTDLAERLPKGILSDDHTETVSLDIGHGPVWVYARDPDMRGYQLTRRLPDGGRIARIDDGSRAIWATAPDADADLAEIPIDPAR